jgi:hypothetical protein
MATTYPLVLPERRQNLASCNITRLINGKDRTTAVMNCLYSEVGY